ncbi:MAG: FAD binding domain-containing protein, partial [Rhodospirillales bacterium]|nr:FAD binding domain-containing protein [Rhodospirillales bacterium]
TIGGNLGNASPSAEFAPPLLCLNAVVRCMGPNGARDIPVDEFFLNPGITALGQSEMITEIRVPPPAANKADVYIKHSLRRMDVAMASAAVYVELDGGQIVDARIALGAVAPTPFRAVKSEEILRGNQVSDELIIEAAKMATSEATPIDDIRSYADYRKDTVREMVARGLSQVISERQERVHA